MPQAFSFDAAGNESAVGSAGFVYFARSLLGTADGFAYSCSGLGLRTVTTAPTITGFSPTGGPVGTVVTITGTNLTGATAVKFNGTSATAFTVNSATQITATVPTGATTGLVSVTTPGGTATSSTSFTVGALPTITSFSPARGSAGTSVTINGSNFTGTTAVTFNGTSATFTVNRANKITATVPAGATTRPISVTTPTGTATSATSFTISTPPTVTGFSPTSGPIGTSVTITGTGFTGVTAVKFNGTSATAFTVNSSTQITATVPTGATTGTISVTTAQGTGTSSTSFTVTTPPTITSFSPTSGSVGTSVTIYGTSFTGTTAVRFNGTAATFTVKSATRITTKVPTGATTGPITVTTSGGTATSPSSFTVPGTFASFGGVESPSEVPGSMALTSTPRPEWAEPVATVASLGLVRNAIDGAGFLPSGAENGFGFSGIASDVADAGMFFPATRSSIRSASRVQPLATAAGRRYSFYSPEMSLLAESEIGISPSAPVILYEYVWFNGHPVAQVDGGVTHWTFTDHLGTPILQTDANATMFWRAEYEPFGRIYALRTADQHQPLRLPGQEAEQFNLGPNGVTERSFNVFRWYRPGWGRYSQPDPIGAVSQWGFDSGDPASAQVTAALWPFAYAEGNPLLFIDPTGLLCIYSQRTGDLTCTNDRTGVVYVTCRGYSGRNEGLNNPDAQPLRDTGPLPRGEYTVLPPTNRRGPNTRPLAPSPNNEMFGRSGFLIHGDNARRNNTASEGCIVAPPNCRSAIPAGERLRVVP